MTSSTPSSVSRYRPAVLVLTGAAAAYAAYLIYSSFQGDAPSRGLHRSNAVRRPNPRARRGTARTVARLQRSAPPLGEFDFFGQPIELDARNLISPADLRELAEHMQPSAGDALVEDQVGQFYDTFFDRLLLTTFPNRVLSPTEAEAITQWLGPQIPDQQALALALQRHSSRFGAREGDVVHESDDAESLGQTELSWDSIYSDSDGLDPNGQTLQRTLYHIAEDHARHEGVIHRGVTCNGCDTKPIRGVRWRCANCADFDLCSECEATNSHMKTHIFYKIRVPAPFLGLPKQEPVYPGRPHLMSPSIDSSMKKRLVKETKMEAEEIEALWDQFTCLASVEWEADPTHVGWALDRRAFNQAFVPRYSSFTAAPNLVYDRLFAYYDVDHNGMIGFEEFVKGLDGMHSRDQKTKSRIVFNGYDVDGDGYISRKDVLRIFRAYYAIEKEATRNYLAENSEELSVRGALETIHSSQPLGSAFTQSSIEARSIDNTRLAEKNSGDSGDQLPVIQDDADDNLERADVIRSTQSNRNFEGTHRPLFGDQAVVDRWNRRQFYVDEEEGLSRPEGTDETSLAHDPAEQQVPEEESLSSPEVERPRGSRSSSRVRFQDDVDFETRSNASTSSRPIGERWGGYEIPEPEKDLGKEVLYQITQEAFNELLNPLFQEKEDNAMDTFNSRTERRECANQIDNAIKEFHREALLNKAVVYLGFFRYSKLLVHNSLKGEITKGVFENQGQSGIEAKLNTLFFAAEQKAAKAFKSWPDDWEPNAMALWNAKLCRVQFREEFVKNVIRLATELHWLPPPPDFVSCVQDGAASEFEKPLPGQENIDCNEDGELPYRDPTMPQFRPNSMADVQQIDEQMVLDEEHSQSGSSDTEPYPWSDLSNSDTRLADQLVYYDSYHPSHASDNFIIVSFRIPAAGSENVSASQPDPVRTSSGSDQGDGTLPPVTPAPMTEAPQDRDDESSPSLVPNPIPGSQLPLPSPPPTTPPLVEYTDDPVFFVIFQEEGDTTLNIEVQPLLNWREDHLKLLLQKIRRDAFSSPNPALRIPFLASLEIVEAEISERKGSGLVNYEEFTEKLAEGKLRFMEAWIDWVSF
ncbi:hypothetical protein K491DRAFT_693223 [Lophiostoma macrostomum CBS 122681]|uniref:EF-hand n=1 Tax=Lophiostoma macrostomum CBS 122681 TaxID=1314788 RepID=A0A6A6T874_9PLEO|nr:hypothetical protein K491DRAFT_693223 [Lophiostoma macrostomum CBS 122681]